MTWEACIAESLKMEVPQNHPKSITTHGKAKDLGYPHVVNTPKFGCIHRKSDLFESMMIIQIYQWISGGSSLSSEKFTPKEFELTAGTFISYVR